MQRCGVLPGFVTSLPQLLANIVGDGANAVGGGSLLLINGRQNVAPFNPRTGFGVDLSRFPT